MALISNTNKTYWINGLEPIKTNEPILKIENLCKYGKHLVLEDISFDVARGILSLLGPSAAARRLFSVCSSASMGDVRQDLQVRRDITNLARRKEHRHRFPNYSLFPNMNVYQNIAYMLKRKISAEEIDKKVKEIIDISN